MRFLLVFLLLLFLGQTQADESLHPNVVLIYTDDQGYGDASYLNPDSRFKTPNIDRLAQEGVCFTDAHCSDTVCTPSRYGLLTGRYSWRTELKRGVFNAERKCLIDDSRLTLASLLRNHGYQTAMVGKWHLGMDFPGTRGMRDWTQPVLDMPLDKGFEYFWGIPASMNYGILAWFDGRFAHNPPVQFTQKKRNSIAIADYRIMPPYETTADVRSADEHGKFTGKLEVAKDFIDIACLDNFTTKAIEWMQQRDKKKPFFLYLPYTSPHKPVIPMEQFRGKGRAGAYGEFMIETDWHVGRLLDFLEHDKIANNTIVLFSSDNGPERTWTERKEKFGHASNHIFREGKRSIYEGGHRVPFIVRWPAGIVNPGRLCAQPVCQTDVLATLAELLDDVLPINAGEDSQSFLSALTSQKTDSRLPIIHHGSSGQFAIRDRQWKLVMGKQKSQNRELYNLLNDPEEMVNVIESHQDIADTLEKQLTSIVITGRTTEGPPTPNDTPYWRDLHWMSEQDYARFHTN